MRLLQRLRLRRRILEDVVVAAEVDARLRPEPVHELELLGEHGEADARLREREAVGAVLALHPAGAEAELDPSAGDMVGGRDGVREQAGGAERGGGDERAEPERRRPRRERGDDGPRVVGDVRLLVALRDVMVGAEERPDAVLLTGVCEGAPLLPGDTLLAFDHQCQLHAEDPSAATASARPHARSSTSRHRRCAGTCSRTPGAGRRPWIRAGASAIRQDRDPRRRDAVRDRVPQRMRLRVDVVVVDVHRVATGERSLEQPRNGALEEHGTTRIPFGVVRPVLHHLGDEEQCEAGDEACLPLPSARPGECVESRDAEHGEQDRQRQEPQRVVALDRDGVGDRSEKQREADEPPEAVVPRAPHYQDDPGDSEHRGRCEQLRRPVDVDVGSRIPARDPVPRVRVTGVVLDEVEGDPSGGHASLGDGHVSVAGAQSSRVDERVERERCHGHDVETPREEEPAPASATGEDDQGGGPER